MKGGIAVKEMRQKSTEFEGKKVLIKRGISHG
jgi:hypothetical protein